MAPSLTSRPASDVWLITVALVALGTLILIPLGRAWQIAPDLGHGWAAPMLIGFLYWDRWHDRPAPIVGPRALGLSDLLVLGIAVVASIPLRLILTPFPVWPMPLILYVSFVIGVGLFLINHRYGRPGLRWFGGPLIVLLGVVIWPGIIENNLILPLRVGIASLVAEFSNALGQPALAVGTVLQIGHGWVGIDEACGGIRSLHATVTTALFFGEWLNLSVRRRFALLVFGAMAAFAGNFARISFLAWCGSQSQEMIDQWHDSAGWAALAFSLLVTGAAPYFWKRPAALPASRSQSPRSASDQSFPSQIGSTVITLGVVLTLWAVEGGVRSWYAAGATRQGSSNFTWTVNLPVSEPSFKANSLDVYADEILRPDYFESGHWRGPDRINRMANYIEWRQGQIARTAPFAHNPTICLPYAGFELVEARGSIQVPWQDTFIPFKTYIFGRGTDELVVAFTIWDPLHHTPLRQSSVDAGWTSWILEQWRQVREAREHQPAQLLAFGISDRKNESLLREELTSLLRPPG